MWSMECFEVLTFLLRTDTSSGANGSVFWIVVTRTVVTGTYTHSWVKYCGHADNHGNGNQLL